MIMVQSTFHVLPESRANILEMMKEMVHLCIRYNNARQKL